MAFINKVISKVFGNKSDKEIKVLIPIVDEINKKYKGFIDLDDQGLKDRFSAIRDELHSTIDKQKEDLKKKIFNEEELDDRLYEIEKKYLDDHLTEIFAIVKDVSRRISGKTFKIMDQDSKWEMVHYDVQLIGGIVLHKGKIAEMKTGEGKTLVSTLAVVLNTLNGRGVHLVTVNDYLAQRDSEWMGAIYNFLDLSVGCLLDRMSPLERKEQYGKDITYGTNSQFGFDYLRDNMAPSSNEQVQRKHVFAIIDEVDSVLIDEARTPLIISGAVDVPTNQEFGEWRDKIDSLVRTQNKMVSSLVSEAEEILETNSKEAGVKLLTASRGFPKNKDLMKIFQQTGTKKLVSDTESGFIREKTMPTIDEALYFVIDENARVTDLSDKGREYLSPSNPEYFIIPDIGDMFFEIENSDNLSEEEIVDRKQEAQVLHGERSERIHIINKLLQAFCMYEKDNEYIVQDGKVQIVDEHTGRVLHGRKFSDGLHEALEVKEKVVIGRESQTHATITIQNYFRMYEKLAGMTGTATTEAQEFMEIYKLDVTEIPTNEPILRVDNNDLIFRSKREKYNAVVEKIKEVYLKGQPTLVGTTSVEESEILSKMLKISKIPHNVLNAKQHQREAEIVARAGHKSAITISTNMAGRGTDIKLGEGVKELGGLLILGTGRHESRRIDLQLRGRTGRQGDTGESIFYLSLEDDLMRIFGSDRIAVIMDKLGIQEGEVITHAMITKSVERAQKKLETRNFTIRKHVLEYDMVMNKQREIIYDRRNYALGQDQTSDVLGEIIGEFIDDTINNYIKKETSFNSWDMDGLNHELLDSVSIDIKNSDQKIDNIDSLRAFIRTSLEGMLEYKKSSIDENIFNQFLRFTILKVIDKKWREHLYAMDQIREGINLRAYGQKNPLIEYKKEGYALFEDMMVYTNKEILKNIFRTNLTMVDSNKIVIKSDIPKDMKLEHDMISGLNLPRQNPSSNNQMRQSAEISKLSPVKQDKKYGRNDRVTIANGTDTKTVKYKKAEILINQGWSIVE